MRKPRHRYSFDSSPAPSPADGLIGPAKKGQPKEVEWSEGTAGLRWGGLAQEASQGGNTGSMQCCGFTNFKL